MSDELEVQVAECYACGSAMNVSALAPFSRAICPSCGSESRVKMQFGAYILNRRHAIGGMSSVFVAVDYALNREVALKILSEDYSQDSKRITAFEEEARLTASFSHPHVVRVFTTGKAFGRFYIAMELVTGGHFEKKIREWGRIPEKELLPFAIQVAEGLKGAKAAGLIHRDIKPGNILLDSGGNAKIVDFGLALVTKGGSAKAEEIWATPYYVPPETIEGEVEDFRSDIYAFGATFYHALAGKPPCDEQTMATDRLREAKKKIVSLRDCCPDLMPETCETIDRAMAYHAEDRFSSYDELIASLKLALKVVKGEIPSQLTESMNTRKRNEQRVKNRRRGILLAGITSLLATGMYFVLKPEEEKRVVSEEPKLGTVLQQELTTNDESTADVGAAYLSAREALRNGNYKTAERIFTQLFQNDNVQEPTRTWAGLEALAVKMMQGEMNQAKEKIQLLSAHISVNEDASLVDIKELIAPLFLSYDDFNFHTFLDKQSSDDCKLEFYFAYLISGLKNWEQGGLKQALPYFQAISQETTLSNHVIFSIYFQKAQDYLDDYRLLSSNEFSQLPKNATECRDYLDEFNRVASLLKTDGRARYNLNARREDLIKLERSFLNQDVTTVDSEADSSEPFKHFTGFAKNYRFSEMLERLKDFQEDPKGVKADSLRYVIEGAMSVIEQLEKDLSGAPVDVDIRFRDGAKIILLVKKENILYSKLENGEVRKFGWRDLAPGQIYGLHKQLLSRSTDDADRLSRQKALISFDWLSCDRQRALHAAKDLSKDNEEFKNTWKRIRSGLPE